jgi:hypothetical protein
MPKGARFCNRLPGRPLTSAPAPCGQRARGP